MTTATIPLGQYLWERIKQVGVARIFGVPGDFNLTLLDHIYTVDGLEWVGSTNELNGGYAADGYARVKDGAGCVVTTHGVGELSALNAIAGSMTEQVKVIHVVGQTSRAMQKKHVMIHHSIGFEPDHQIFNVASRGFRVAAAELQHDESAADEIDRTLRECFVKSGPVYVFFPVDMVEVPVPSKRLETPLNLKPDFDEETVQEAARAILEAIYNSKNPGLYVDALVSKRQASAEARELVHKLGILTYTSNLSKGVIDENAPNYVGLYSGIATTPGVDTSFENHDLMVVLGHLPCDTNSGGFTSNLVPERSIFVNTDDVQIAGKSSFKNAPIKYVLQSLIKEIKSGQVLKATKPKLPDPPVDYDRDSKLIRQSWVWKYLGENFFESNDVIFGETGTAAFGIPDVEFPPNVQWITQTYYGSIGFSTPAAVGADVALIEKHETQGAPRGRTILATGDGSLMLTVQEVGNMVKLGISPIIFIVNNSGYTVERLIHGAKSTYNDIVPFDYRHMLPFFNMPEAEAKKNFHRAETKVELQEILKLDSLRRPKTVQVVEMVMDKLDVPWKMYRQVASRGEEAIKEMTEAGFKSRPLSGKVVNTWD